MNIYKVSQDENNDYDTFDSFVCYAATSHQAKKTLPSKNSQWEHQPYDWCTSPKHTTVEYIGTNKLITEASVIVASFNEG